MKIAADYLCMPAEKQSGAPYAGKLHVRCDEGRARSVYGLTAPPTLLVQIMTEFLASQHRYGKLAELGDRSIDSPVPRY